MANIRVFIVDDSAVVRQVLTSTLDQVAGIEVIGSANDPIFAESKMAKNWPDVIILDVEMPRMDGITFLRKLMKEHPTPVIMCSTLTVEGSKTSLQALSLGAIDVVAKPKADVKNVLPEASKELVAAIRVAAKANLKAIKTNIASSAKPAARPVEPIPGKMTVEKKLTADSVIKKSRPRDGACAGTLIAIGASTGGTQALERVLARLPAKVAPILIVQHMPENFTATFAQRLNDLCEVEVKEAEDNDVVIPGRVLIAPGGKHMLLHSTRFGTTVRIKDGPRVSRHRPSVDVLFRSVSQYAGNKAMGIIMTGMGDDGARGMKEMSEVGAVTVAQDQKSCVVYGMPQEAVKLHAVDTQVPLDRIADTITAFSQQR